MHENSIQRGHWDIDNGRNLIIGLGTQIWFLDVHGYMSDQGIPKCNFSTALKRANRWAVPPTSSIRRAVQLTFSTHEFYAHNYVYIDYMIHRHYPWYMWFCRSMYSMHMLHIHHFFDISTMHDACCSAAPWLSVGGPASQRALLVTARQTRSKKTQKKIRAQFGGQSQTLFFFSGRQTDVKNRRKCFGNHPFWASLSFFLLDSDFFCGGFFKSHFSRDWLMARSTSVCPFHPPEACHSHSVGQATGCSS